MQRKYSDLIKFLLLTFIISWLSWGILILLNQDIFILRTLGSYGPLLALILLIVTNKDRLLKNRLLKSVKTWRVSIWWYIFAVFGTAVIGLIAVFINNLFFSPVTFTEIDPIFILIAIPYVLITSVLGEEAGWRGYALNFLNNELGSIKGSIVLGAIWGLWHLPLFFMNTDFHQSIPILLFLAQSVFMTFIYTWIYAKTKSLLIQIIFHTFSNITIGLLPLIPSMNGGNLTPLIIAVIFLGILTIILILRNDIESKPSNAAQNHQYKAKGQEPTQFEIYLKYSTEKEVSVRSLSQILSSVKISGKDILDIGCGDGSYLLNTLKTTKFDKSPNITLLEPSKPLFEKLIDNTSDLSYNIKTINQTFEDFNLKNSNKYDLLLASHLYHFSRSEYSSILNSMLSLLKSTGTLIWVERAPDDIADFKKHFKSKLLPSKYPPEWKPRDYKYAYEILENMSEIKKDSTQMFENESVLNIPYKDSLEDTVAIIEFYLNIQWSSLSESTKEEILGYIRDKRGVFTQREAIIVYRTLPF